MRIATWNINGLRARLDFIRFWLDARAPDVVGLQELKMTDEQFPAEAFEAAGYRAITYGQKAWNGVAILSRGDAEVRHKGLPGQADFGSRLVSARVEGLDFTTVYCPNGKSVSHDDYPRKLAWFDALADYLRSNENPDADAVLCGDFNICPLPLDSWDEEAHAGEIFHTDAERERFSRLLDFGLTDIYRERFPEAREFSWWDYRAGGFPRNQGLRIDFLLATRSALARVRSVEIDRDFRKKKEGLTASDHAPVMADLD